MVTVRSGTVQFVAFVSTVLFVVAAPVCRNTFLILALELVAGTLVLEKRIKIKKKLITVDCKKKT